MRRNIIVQPFTLLALLFYCTSCNSKKTIDSMKEDSLFVWQPALTAPIYYPIKAKYAYVMVGTDMKISMGDTNVGYGVGNGFSTVDFSEGQGGLEIPTGLDVLWLSFAEKNIITLSSVSPRVFKSGFCGCSRKGTIMVRAIMIVSLLRYCQVARYGCLFQG